MNHAIISLLLFICFSRSLHGGRLKLFVTFSLVAVFLLYGSDAAKAHPMPNSLVMLDVQEHQISAELQLPLVELELAFGKPLSANAANMIVTDGKELEAYIVRHLTPTSKNGQAWTVAIDKIELHTTENAIYGVYQELRVFATMTPPVGLSTRDCIFKYDVILHQLVTHSALVSIRQDWDAGIVAENPVEIGVIAWDIRTSTLSPLMLHQGNISLWLGFVRMVRLGMQHISEGTDHLLFLLVLLLPSPLLVEKKRWADFGGIRYSLTRVLVIVTSFTVGHSLTLIIGALGWVRLPTQPIEVLIAVSIIVSAVHAVYPLFANKESFIAAGFGLVHGLAFATTLLILNVTTGRIALSILGFNLGIELMQIAVITVMMPWLLLMSRFRWYNIVRVTGAFIAGIVAFAWATERVTNHSNFITAFVGTILKGT